MRKCWLIFTLLICLFLIGCGKQETLKNDFSMKEKCAKYNKSWEKEVNDWRENVEWGRWCDTSVYYSNYRNSCIWESICSHWWYAELQIVDLLENTTLYSENGAGLDWIEFDKLHDLYYN